MNSEETSVNNNADIADGEENKEIKSSRPKLRSESSEMSDNVFTKLLNSTSSPPIKEKFCYKNDLTTKQREEVLEAFNSFDRGTGAMDVKDLKIAIRSLGFEPKKNEIKKLMIQYDKSNSSEKLDFNEFLEIMGAKFAEKDSKEEINKAFRLFDRDQKGKITFENLKQIAIELGEGLNDEEVKEMITEADFNGDGVVSQDEFYRIMKKTSLY